MSWATFRHIGTIPYCFACFAWLLLLQYLFACETGLCQDALRANPVRAVMCTHNEMSIRASESMFWSHYNRNRQRRPHIECSRVRYICESIYVSTYPLVLYVYISICIISFHASSLYIYLSKSIYLSVLNLRCMYLPLYYIFPCKHHIHTYLNLSIYLYVYTQNMCVCT